MSKEQDKIFFRNYSIVIGILALMIIIFLIAARSIGISEEHMNMSAEHTTNVEKATQPVGQVQIKGQEQTQAAAAPAEKTAATGGSEKTGDVGKQVFNGLCVSCHGAGLPGVPQFGNKKEWAPRIAKGKSTLYKHALHGFSSGGPLAMPPKGGNPALSDAQVKAAVDYMVANSQ
ncbi:MAG: c-type cytochrome [Gammaproteobacteria bacterium]|jgi:cytochrome c5